MNTYVVFGVAAALMFVPDPFGIVDEWCIAIGAAYLAGRDYYCELSVME